MLLFTDGFDVWLCPGFMLAQIPLNALQFQKKVLAVHCCFSCENSLFFCVEFSPSFPSPLHKEPSRPLFICLIYLPSVARSLPFQSWQFFFPPVVSLNSLLSSFQEPFLQPPNPSQPPLPLRNCLFWSPWQQEPCVNLFLWFASACILRVHQNQPASCLWQSCRSLQRWENQGWANAHSTTSMDVTD